ncbi:ADP-ribosylation factor family-domain-containing protein [Mycena rosella]|uniref:ADP-ribosylation factor family-domain-containing protein n=1 Tax=Mycena rosella TaxID=1033263 RepID=A0AAD7DML6_MYCRO|nr:ADP-ribosylation factor family-domain-containing protein [Mycena rosella]
MTPNLSLRRFVDRFYSRPSSSKNGYTIPLLGLAACGKTTFLTRMTIREPVKTSPTLGIYLETANVRLAAITDKPLNIRSWDVGGSGKRLPPAFLAHYTQTAGSDALIWMVDSSDRERLAESVEELGCVVDLVSYPTMNSREIPVLILATKQDFSNAMTPGEIQKAFESVTSGLNVFVVGNTLEQSLTEGTLPEAFRWLLRSVENVRAGKPPPPSPTDDPRSPLALEIKLDSWLERAETDSSTTQLLLRFENINLPAWDHYTRIRVMYSMLTVPGRNTGRAMIMQGFATYTTLSEQPFHVTMTYFWIQVVHFCICGMPPAAAAAPQLGSNAGSLSYLEAMLDNEMLFDAESIASKPASDWSLLDDDMDGSSDEDGDSLGAQDENSVDTEEDSESEADDSDKTGPPDAGFVRFLLLSPFVADEELWTEYYSRDVMMSPKARARMVLPDRRRLPNLVGREVISSSLKGRV